MKNVGQEEWRTLLNSTENKIILDVRTPNECSSGVQIEAEQLNFLDGPAFMKGVEELDASKSYFVYCRSGNRSAQACQVLTANGIENTYNLLGGMLEWKGETTQP